MFGTRITELKPRSCQSLSDELELELWIVTAIFLYAFLVG